MPRGKARGKRDALSVVRAVRRAVRKAGEALRAEIQAVGAKLAELVTEEKRFLRTLGKETGARARLSRPRRGRAARRRMPVAAKFFEKLPRRFTIDHVRRLAGRLSGVSLAQWTRAKRIRKDRRGYVKV